MEKFIEEKIKAIETDIKNIKENHLYHIQNDISNMKVSVKEVSTNQNWLMKFFWIIASTSVAGLITGIINLLTK